MTCLAITRAGRGRVWRYDSARSARMCPIVQLADVVAESSSDLWANYASCAGELAELVGERLGPDVVGAAERLRSESTRGAREEVRRVAADVWDYLVRCASTPPTDPAEVVSVIVGDRAAVEGVVLRSRGSRHTEAEQQSGESIMAAGDRRDRISNDSVIRMKSNDKGPYGPKNNPKRAGSASAARFDKYKDGMTVGAAKEAGLTASDISYDSEHGYIELRAAAAPKAAATA